MRLPNWFRIAWWLALLLFLTWFLYKRYFALIEGNTSVVDVLACIIWLVLLLFPLFQEISLLGVSLKGEIKDLKEDVKSEVEGLRSDIRNSIDMRTNISPNFYLPPPPPDAKLPEVEEQIKRMLESALKDSGVQQTATADKQMSVDDNTLLLFQARHNIEKEVRRLYEQRFSDEGRRQTSIYQMAKTLADGDLIDPRIVKAIREVYSIASPAIHGDAATAAQVDFVRDVAPKLIATLRAVQ